MRGAVVRFDGPPVLDGLDLSVAAGEVVAVLTPAVWKSTLPAPSLACAVEAGEIVLHDRDVSALPTEAREIGFLQRPVPFPTRDVAGNLRLGIPRGSPASGEHAHRHGVEEVGLAGFEGRSIEGLSGGEGQRVVFARALLENPRPCCSTNPSRP